jgi:hypothetical protein
MAATQSPMAVPTFYYDPDHDTNDGKQWSEADITDLKNSLAHGTSIEETAGFLGRSGSVEDVIKKANELGLKFERRTTEARKPYRGSTTLPKPSERGEKETRPGQVFWKGRWVPRKVREPK